MSWMDTIKEHWRRHPLGRLITRTPAAPAPPATREGKADGVRLFGHMFHPMGRLDYEALAGAREGSLVCYCEDGTTLVVDPEMRQVTEVLAFEDDAITSRGEQERTWALAWTR